ncbi:MAG: hypothetical protein ABJB55_02580 [Actinomycetota bacterium]
MAIKGKGKTKSKQPARAPKRGPVPVPKPFAQRTWVRLMATFIAGVFLVSMCWWVWEGLDKNRNAKAAAATRAQQQQGILAWKATLEPTLSTVGTVQGSATPQVAASLAPAIDAIAKGTDPGVKATDLDTLAKQLDHAASALEKFTLTDAIGNHGFDLSQTDVITSAHDEVAAGLRSLAVAARLTALAIASPDQAKALAAEAQRSSDTGQSLIQHGWTKYENIAAAAGIPLPAFQGLPSGSGS